MTPAVADVLEALLTADGPLWGLKIVKHIDRPAGSVYPILGRLEGAGWATSNWDDDADRSGPRRRHYVLSDEAKAPARALVAEVRERQLRMTRHVRGASA